MTEKLKITSRRSRLAHEVSISSRRSNCLAHEVSISSFRISKAYRFRGSFRENIEPSRDSAYRAPTAHHRHPPKKLYCILVYMYTIKIGVKARVLYRLSGNRRLRQSNCLAHEVRISSRRSNCLAHEVSISSFRISKAYRFRGSFRENIEPSRGSAYRAPTAQHQALPGAPTRTTATVQSSVRGRCFRHTERMCSAYAFGSGRGSSARSSRNQPHSSVDTAMPSESIIT